MLLGRFDDFAQSLVNPDSFPSARERHFGPHLYFFTTWIGRDTDCLAPSPCYKNSVVRFAFPESQNEKFLTHKHPHFRIMPRASDLRHE